VAVLRIITKTNQDSQPQESRFELVTSNIETGVIANNSAASVFIRQDKKSDLMSHVLNETINRYVAIKTSANRPRIAG
jgi:hypothetical protein